MVRSAYLSSYLGKVKERLPNAAGVSTLFLPAASALETAVAGMADSVSMQSRLYGMTFSAAILPAALDLRERSRSYFSATEKGMRRIAHDTALYLALSGGYKIGAYVAAGERDLERMLVGTALVSIGTAVAAPVLLAAGEYFEGAFGKGSRSLPKAKRIARRCIAGALVAASLLGTAAIYVREWPAQLRDAQHQAGLVRAPG